MILFIPKSVPLLRQFPSTFIILAAAYLTLTKYKKTALDTKAKTLINNTIQLSSI